MECMTLQLFFFMKYMIYNLKYDAFAIPGKSRYIGMLSRFDYFLKKLGTDHLAF